MDPVRLLAPWLLAVLGLVLATVPQALASEGEPDLDEATRARIEAIGERISELLAETPSEHREAVRRELLRMLATDGGVTPAQEASTEAVAESIDPPAEAPEPPAEATVVAAGREGGSPQSREDATREPQADVAAMPRPSVAEEAPVAEPEAVSPVAPPPPSPPTRRVRAPRCTTLLSFDENEDGKVNAQDRWWRHLYVWIDRNGDGQPEERELESAYERGVREIDAGLEGFYRKKGSLGEVRYDDTLLFDLGGDGFGAGRRPDDGALAVDATALRRGTGPSLEGTGGAPLEGIQPFRQGQHLVFDDGRRVELTCRRR